MAGLPHVLAEIAAVAGEDAALAIAEARGGTPVYIPPDPDPDHWLSRLVGRERAKAIAEQLTCGVGGVRIDIPQGPAGTLNRIKIKADAMISEGESSARDISRATGYSMRTVYRRRARLRDEGDDRQLNLL